MIIYISSPQVIYIYNIYIHVGCAHTHIINIYIHIYVFAPAF